MTLKEVQDEIRIIMAVKLLLRYSTWDHNKTVKFKQMLIEREKHLQKNSNLEKAQGFLLRLNEFN